MFAPILAIACLTTVQPVVEKTLLSTPEGRLQALKSLGRALEVSTSTRDELFTFEKKYRLHLRLADAVWARQREILAIKDPLERQKAAIALGPEVQEVRRQSAVLKHEWAEFERRVQERREKR